MKLNFKFSGRDAIGSMLALGARSCWFKSNRPDHFLSWREARYWLARTVWDSLSYNFRHESSILPLSANIFDYLLKNQRAIKIERKLKWKTEEDF